MTDNEKAKALECCIVGDCDDCPYDEQTACKEYLLQDALDLINRLQAENERLTKSNRNWRRKVQRLRSVKAENEKLKHESDVSIEDIHSLSDQVNELIEENEELKFAINGFRGYEDKIKAEAYKECAEKIKQKTLAMIYSSDELTTDDYTGCIDDVVKELEGDNN